MKAQSTYRDFVEALASLLGVLGVALCLQIGVLQTATLADWVQPGHEGLCCIKVSTDHGHQHAQSNAAAFEHLPAVVPANREFLSGTGTGMILLYKPYSLHQLEAHSQAIGQQANYARSTLLTARHIVFRNIRI